MIDEPGGAHGVKGRGDDAGAGGNSPQLLRQLRLADNQTADAHFNGPTGHFRLVAANNDGVCFPEQQALPGLGQGDGHFAGNRIHQVAVFVENLALQDAQQIEHRDLVHLGHGGDFHVKIGDFGRGNHAEEMAVLVGDGNAGDVPVGLQGLPGPGDGHTGIEGRGHIIVQVANLSPHGDELDRRLKIKTFQNPVGFVADVAQPGSHILPVAQGVAQGGVGDGRHDGVRIRIAVSGDIDRIHSFPPFLNVVYHIWENCDILNG